MVKLPDQFSLGPYPNGAYRYHVSPASDLHPEAVGAGGRALAQGISQGLNALGDAFQGQIDTQNKQQDAMDLIRADVGYQQDLGDLKDKYAQDEDYNTHLERFDQDRQEAINKYQQQFRNPIAAERWGLHATQKSFPVREQINKSAMQGVQEQKYNELNGQLEATQKLYDQAQTDEEREAILKQRDDIINIGAHSGLIRQKEAQTLRQNWLLAPTLPNYHGLFKGEQPPAGAAPAQQGAPSETNEATGKESGARLVAPSGAPQVAPVPAPGGVPIQTNEGAPGKDIPGRLVASPAAAAPTAPALTAPATTTQPPAQDLGAGQVAGRAAQLQQQPSATALQVSPQDRDMMIRTVIGEAENQNPEGQRAVANVIANRLRVGYGGAKNASDVALAPNQFEPWTRRENYLRGIDPNSAAYKNAAAAVDDVIAGKTPDNSQGATHFYGVDSQAARGRGAPSWASEMPQTARIGEHAFFQDKRYAGALQQAQTVQQSGPKIGAKAGYEAAKELGIEPRFNQARNLNLSGNLVTLRTNSGAEITVDAKTAPQWQGFLHDLEATGYYINPKNTGGYNDRSQISGSPSQHAIGNAVDINWWEAGNKKDAAGTNNLPANVGQIADKWGISWGGHFRQAQKDAMHFEVSRLVDTSKVQPDEPQGGQRYAQAASPAASDATYASQAPIPKNVPSYLRWMTPGDWAKLQKQYEAYSEKQQTGVREQVRTQIGNDIAAIKGTGQAPVDAQGRTSLQAAQSLFADPKHQEEYLKFQNDWAKAQMEHDLLGPLGNMTDDEVRKHINDPKFAPQPGQPYYQAKQELLDKAQKQIEKNRELWGSDPAAAAENADEVKRVRDYINNPQVKNANGLITRGPDMNQREQNEAIVAARLAAQQRHGLYPDQQSVLTEQEAKKLLGFEDAKKVPMEQFEGQLKRAWTRAQEQYGDYAQHAYDSAIRRMVTENGRNAIAAHMTWRTIAGKEITPELLDSYNQARKQQPLSNYLQRAQTSVAYPAPNKAQSDALVQNNTPENRAIFIKKFGAENTNAILAKAAGLQGGPGKSNKLTIPSAAPPSPMQ